MERITEKQIRYISYKIFKVFLEDEKWKSLIDIIPKRIEKVGEQTVNRTIQDFEKFLEDNFNSGEASLFIQMILGRNVKGIIQILKAKNYKGRLTK
jgi:hypothetical protein